jgi:hypothetical protein
VTIFEVAVSAVVLGVVVTTGAQLVQWSMKLHQAALKRRCALEAATSVLDRISSRPWSEITADSVKRLDLPTESKEFLVDPHLSVAVAEERDQPRSKKISVEIAWAERAGQPTQQVHLATWVFALEKKK